jgi:hypothetical protein
MNAIGIWRTYSPVEFHWIWTVFRDNHSALGIADLCVGFVSIGTLVTQASEKTLELCLIRIGFTIAACIDSLLFLMLIAIDRYIAVFRGLRYIQIVDSNDENCKWYQTNLFYILMNAIGIWRTYSPVEFHWIWTVFRDNHSWCFTRIPDCTFYIFTIIGWL